MAAGEKHEALAYCGGFRVEASDGVIGEVETPLFPPDAAAPDYLVIRASGRGRVHRPVVPTALVDRVDAVGRVVVLRGHWWDIARLPEHLPLAVREPTPEGVASAPARQ
jgi:hypothetical protein